MRLKHILSMVVVWQLVCVVVLLFAVKIFPENRTFLGGGGPVYDSNPLLYSRGNFDGLHYVYIATRGYGYAEHAFFPLYPNLIKKLTQVTFSPYLSGVVISLASITLGLWFFAKLLALDYPKKLIFWVIFSLLIFPTSFYFGAVYTESLFFLLIMMSFYYARKGNWLLAGIAGGLAAYSRFVGIFMFPALVVEFFSQPNLNIKSVKNIFGLFCVLLVPVGLLTYMSYLQSATGDPLAFLHALPSFGSYRSESITMIYQVFWRYAKMIWTVQKGTLLYSSVVYEGAVGLLFFVLTIYAFFKIRISYAVFMAFAYIAPTLTGSFVSLPRYVLICFPGFILLGKIVHKYPKVKKIYLIICLITFIFMVSLFSRGFWVA